MIHHFLYDRSFKSQLSRDIRDGHHFVLNPSLLQAADTPVARPEIIDFCQQVSDRSFAALRNRSKPTKECPLCLVQPPTLHSDHALGVAFQNPHASDEIS